MQPTSPRMAPDPSDQLAEALPDHTQLPDKDGNFVMNFQEHPQSNLLTGSLLPRLHNLHPDGKFSIGVDSGIYFHHTQPQLKGCRAPAWFYVPNVPPMLNGKIRRSYVLWKEMIRPMVVIEYVSGDGREERDKTPYEGKFWIYEQAIGAGYYAIFQVERSSIELFRLEGGLYQPVVPNASGRLPIKQLGVELGIWQGTHRGITAPWVRVWDAATGKMMPSEEERAETAEALLDDARRRLEEECERAENERRRAAQLAERLRALGVDPDAPLA
jgi:Uma2 family endonuclease